MLTPFHLLHPTSVPEATGELQRLGDRVKVYAGGAELLLLLRHKLLATEHLLNIKNIAELNGIVREGPLVRIGATVTHQRLESDTLVRQCLPMLAYAESQVANIRVRNQGTLGGNLCFNDPHSDPGTTLLVYEATAVLAGPSGSRRVPLDDFLVGMYQTALESDELLVEIQVPLLPPGFGSVYLRLHRFQRPTLGVAVAAMMQNERIAGVRLAVGCIGPKAERLRELEAQLIGASLIEAGRVVREAKQRLADLFRPVDDLLGSADYKLYLTQTLLQRGLQQAVHVDGDRDGDG